MKPPREKDLEGQGLHVAEPGATWTPARHRPVAPVGLVSTVRAVPKSAAVSPTDKPLGLSASGEAFRAVRQGLGLGQQAMHRLAGLSVRSLSALETGTKRPSREDIRRYRELERLRAALADLVEAEAIAPWLETPNPQFGDLSPLEVIERGEIDRVWRLIWRLQDGVPLD